MRLNQINFEQIELAALNYVNASTTLKGYDGGGIQVKLYWPQPHNTHSLVELAFRTL